MDHPLEQLFEATIFTIEPFFLFSIKKKARVGIELLSRSPGKRAKVIHEGKEDKKRVVDKGSFCGSYIYLLGIIHLKKGILYGGTTYVQFLGARISSQI